MADPFSILCEYIQLNKPIAILTAKGKELTESQLAGQDELPGYLSFGASLCYSASTLSPIRSSRGGGSEPYYTLFCIYYAYLRRNASFMEYLQEARNKGWPSVSLVDRKDILAILDGTLKVSNLIDTDNREIWSRARPISVDTVIRGKRVALESMEAGEPGIEAPRQLPIDMPAVLPDDEASVALEAKPSEKSLRPRNAVFLSKNKTYGQAIALMKSLLRAAEPSRHAGAASSASQKKLLPVANARASTMRDEYSVQTTASLLPSSVQRTHHPAAPSAASSMAQSGGALHRQHPIIIVPAASCSLLNLYNVKDFLENEKFVSPEEARLKAQNRKEPVVLVHRKSKGNPALAMTYQVIDSIQRLKPEDWVRVVAVFAQGAAWQFKGWKYDQPVELFSHVKGFHLKYEDDMVSNPAINSWNVTALAIHKTKRYLDVEAAVNFWTRLDAWLSSHPRQADAYPVTPLKEGLAASALKKPAAAKKHCS